ncbi:hypothetical protein SU69_04300 [Thermosipho melanesiensis]|uniref:Uncharacterized protein-like protein n=2 Tax=Thermosipho melanesiensis TaxID=46541 RepID=A6LLA2_THEM4|nr:TIGR03936 family radical SAM-associated protein [Thermosipho melanesiensis]ABR30703.1 Uncharacterized protein-like protein [Thermosipho melanesiensis BI429]APT73833.1 hypothetical protein BW47_04530 [Thermosipho melanesiensis]OOC35772.1 hypothetical protein SU68_04355 [Thermosipho melanesiensis]OOC39071.1 hypothetical protein SU69_04300 [Thermosipho melanesiensis]OOC39219.1 hypothetical protein SU70_04300 [Thermosipho melanesiensis]
MSRFVIKFKKLGMYRFISGLDTISLIERTFRRTQLSLIFTEGFHPKPKFTYIDPVSTGVIDLAFYLTIEFSKDYDEKIVKRKIKEVQPLYFVVDLVSKDEITLSKINAYEFLVIIKKPFELPGKVVKKTKRGFKEIQISTLRNLDIVEKKDYIMLNYIVEKGNTFNPYILSDNVFLAIRKECYIDNKPVSSLLKGV